ncbi:hypothetical protein RISK_003040 [Rhodopirellula islandica]|uniref:Uncharacterized protein n=1 Tax=Rhodopirellula islandica TaxID=595434 RepID=A0A0J1BDV6_RHOIS|nr:hypothetical protein RISK_003040 [Rhodopirellula islandica]
MVTPDSRNASQRPCHVARQQTPPSQTLGDKGSTLAKQSVGQVPPGEAKRVVTQDSRNASQRPRHVA